MREKPVTDTQPMSISMATPQGISLSIIPIKALPLLIFEDMRPWEQKLAVEDALRPRHPRGPAHLRSAQGLQRNRIQLQREAELGHCRHLQPHTEAQVWA